MIVMKEVASILKRPSIFQKQETIISAVCAWQTTDQPKEMDTMYGDVLAVLNDPKLRYKHDVIQYDSKIHT